MKILVFGANGQLGSELVREGSAHGLTREDVDVRDLKAVKKAIEQYHPDVVFNATAYNAVDKAESEKDEALLVNGIVPGKMAAICAAKNIPFVHYSTDYVFGDSHAKPISELEIPEPLSVYGHSKLFGENAVLRSHPGAIVIRTTGIYSSGGQNFVKTMQRLGKERGSLRVVSDQFVAPTAASTLAKISLRLAELGENGIFHVVSQSGTSWYEFAQAIFELSELDVELQPVKATEWGAPARRPRYSVLDTARLRLLGLDESIGSWRAELEQFFVESGE